MIRMPTLEQAREEARLLTARGLTVYVYRMAATGSTRRRRGWSSSNSSRRSAPYRASAAVSDGLARAVNFLAGIIKRGTP